MTTQPDANTSVSGKETSTPSRGQRALLAAQKAAQREPAESDACGKGAHGEQADRETLTLEADEYGVTIYIDNVYRETTVSYCFGCRNRAEVVSFLQRVIVDAERALSALKSQASRRPIAAMQPVTKS